MIAPAPPTPARWQFWIDRGGTFTDIVARRPDGRLLTHKLLSDNPEHYPDAALRGLRDLLNVAADQPIPAASIAAVKMGTTVATNALLERKGDRTLLLITQGFRDALRIGYQNRPKLFARQIVLPELLYERVAEVRERVSAHGNEQHQYYETICGGAGAGPGFDGASAVHTHMTNSRLTDPEVLEWRFPVRVEDFCIRTGSGGAGRWRGGDGVIRRIRFLEPMTAAILSGHRRIPPYGLAGGKPGQVGRNAVERADGQTEELPGTAQVTIGVNDLFVIETPGGGGYG